MYGSMSAVIRSAADALSLPATASVCRASHNPASPSSVSAASTTVSVATQRDAKRRASCGSVSTSRA